MQRQDSFFTRPCLDETCVPEISKIRHAEGPSFDAAAKLAGKRVSHVLAINKDKQKGKQIDMQNGLQECPGRRGHTGN
jgi:hypothetical protein